MREDDWQVLELALQHVQEVDNKTSGVTRDWTSLGLLLKSLRDSITKPLQRLPLPIATFVSEGVLVVTRVGHPLFTPLTKFLVTRPFLDHAEVRPSSPSKALKGRASSVETARIPVDSLPSAHVMIASQPPTSSRPHHLRTHASRISPTHTHAHAC
jgi:hypothetical protein